MKLLLDENMPWPLASAFPQSFTVHTVQQMGWTGIISYYSQPRSSWQPIVGRNGTPFTNPAGEPGGYVQENPGIVVAIGIRHTVSIGFQLPADEGG